jgi:hypothetical protein
MLHVGLDLSRKRVDVCLISDQGELVDQLAAPFDTDGLCRLTERVATKHSGPVRAVVGSMNGARFIHDTLEAQGWDVLVADAQRVKGLAPLACKTDKIDARVLAELSFRDLVPAIWLPDPQVRRERELARFRLHLVRHRLFTPAMPKRPLEPWMTSASGPFVSIKPGGPLKGVVTISANTETDSPPLIVDATWKPLPKIRNGVGGGARPRPLRKRFAVGRKLATQRPDGNTRGWPRPPSDLAALPPGVPGVSRGHGVQSPDPNQGRNDGCRNPPQVRRRDGRAVRPSPRGG